MYGHHLKQSTRMTFPVSHAPGSITSRLLPRRPSTLGRSDRPRAPLEKRSARPVRAITPSSHTRKPRWPSRGGSSNFSASRSTAKAGRMACRCYSSLEYVDINILRLDSPQLFFLASKLLCVLQKFSDHISPRFEAGDGVRNLVCPYQLTSPRYPAHLSQRCAILPAVPLILYKVSQPISPRFLPALFFYRDASSALQHPRQPTVGQYYSINNINHQSSIINRIHAFRVGQETLISKAQENVLSRLEHKSCNSESRLFHIND